MITEVPIIAEISETIEGPTISVLGTYKGDGTFTIFHKKDIFFTRPNMFYKTNPKRLFTLNGDLSVYYLRSVVVNSKLVKKLGKEQSSMRHTIKHGKPQN